MAVTHSNLFHEGVAHTNRGGQDLGHLLLNEKKKKKMKKKKGS
jgi:hypothetical protein